MLKKDPDKYAYASSGMEHRCIFRGFSNRWPALSMRTSYSAGPLDDVIGNQVPMMFDNLPSHRAISRAGR